MAVSKRRQSNNVLVGTISSSESKVVDSTDLTQFRGSQLLVSVYNRTQNVNRNFTMCLGLANGEPQDQIFNKIGDSLSIEVQSLLNGSLIEVQITNNEGYSLDYAITKFDN